MNDPATARHRRKALSLSGADAVALPEKAESTPASLEAALWEAANRLRSNMDAAKYKHVVLGLIFLKYVS